MTDITGLRERRRLATSAEIEAAAFDLFARFGSEHTTVDDIAAAAGVSPRTFFRYFPTKEDAVFRARHAFFEAISDHIAAHVPGVITFGDLTRATTEVLATFSAGDGSPLHQLIRLRCLCRDDSNLRRASLLLDAEQRRRRQVEITAAGGCESALRARILIETLDVVLGAALDEWAGRCAAGEDTALVDVFRATSALQRQMFDGDDGTPVASGARHHA